MEYLIHSVLNRSSLISCKLLALYSTLKLRLAPNSSIDSKLGFLSVSLRLYFQVFPNSQRDFGIFLCCSGWTSQFFPIQEKKDGKLLLYLNISLGCTSELFPIH